MDEKEERNARVQARYDALMREAKHGHYETMFKVVREEVEAERVRCTKVAEKEGSSLGEAAIGAAIAKAIREPR